MCNFSSYEETLYQLMQQFFSILTVVLYLWLGKKNRVVSMLICVLHNYETRFFHYPRYTHLFRCFLNSVFIKIFFFARQRNKQVFKSNAFYWMDPWNFIDTFFTNQCNLYAYLILLSIINTISVNIKLHSIRAYSKTIFCLCNLQQTLITSYLHTGKLFSEVH